jgi:hypothetical protein
MWSPNCSDPDIASKFECNPGTATNVYVRLDKQLSAIKTCQV